MRKLTDVVEVQALAFSVLRLNPIYQEYRKASAVLFWWSMGLLVVPLVLVVATALVVTYFVGTDSPLTRLIYIPAALAVVAPSLLSLYVSKKQKQARTDLVKATQ